MLQSLRTEFVVAALCVIGLLGACLPATAEVYCPQAAPGWGPCAYCPGHYPCVPNAANFGYFPTVWRPWPTEARPDQKFPQSIGREMIPAPPGEKPEPLERIPVEELQPAAQPQSPDAGMTIEGVPAEPGIQSPLQPAPSGALQGMPLESALPSLDAIPQDNGSAPLLPDAPGDSLPAPSGDEGSQLEHHGYGDLLLSDAEMFPNLPKSPLGFEPELTRIPMVSQDAVSQDAVSQDAVSQDMVLKDTASQESPAESVVKKEEESNPSEETAEPSEPKPLALDGYCPVELIEKQAWTLGDERWSSEYNGITYRFAKEAHMNRFMEEPGRYVPVEGGKDPVLLKRDKQTVSGQTDFCAIYKNRLYMFSSRESLTAFRQNPKEYSQRIIRR